MRLSLFILLTCVLFITACDTETKKERPREVWALRSVLDQHPRMLSVALHKDLWIAYNTQSAALYKAWTGGINFEGPVYTSAHGPQPTSKGIAYLEEAIGNPWRVVVNGKEITPDVIYKGHFIKDNQLSIRYELVADNVRIKLTETPEAGKAKDDAVTFERVFVLEGAPQNVVVKVNMHLNSTLKDTDVDTNGKFDVLKKSSENLSSKPYQIIDGTLTLNAGETKFALTLHKRPQSAVTEEKLAGEEAVMAIMAKSDCNTCHNKDVKTVGPAYIDIAKRYPNTPAKEEELIEKIIKGGAGNWGDIPMTAHPDLSKADAKTMVAYILSLDAKQEREEAANKLLPKPEFEINFKPLDPTAINVQEEMKGLAINVYQFADPISDFPDINGEIMPVASGSLNAVHVLGEKFSGLDENFVFHITGFLTLQKTTNLVFRLVSDDGSRLFVDDKLIIDNGGNHGLDPKDGEMNLKGGKHKIRIDYFQGGGGKGLSFQWRTYDSKEFSVVPPELFSFKGSDIKRIQQGAITRKKDLTPGDGSPLVDVHPAFTLAQARPDNFEPKVGGMDFLADGRLVVSTWDSLGSVFILDGVTGKDAGAIKVKRIAAGLAEPLGLKVVDNQIYIMQKQELTRLVDVDGDDIIDEYQTVCNGWRVSSNFHEFAFGLLYKDGYFYGTLATAINPGGASTKPQIPDRGKVVKIAKEDGSFSFVATGLRTPNGIGFGVDNEIYIADNQGDWLPSSKIIRLQEGAWYGSRSVDFEGTANAVETLPVVWLPQDEIGNSPSQPAVLNVGPYKNQMIHGEVTHGGIKRVFAEKVNGQYQGAVFRFTQGLEAGVNRIVWGPDNALYVGGVGSTGNWSHYGKLKYGLQKLTYNDKVPFEMLTIQAKPNGFEIELTHPLKEGAGLKTTDYIIQQWWYKPTEDYGGPKMDLENLTIKKITISSDRKKIFLELPAIKPNHVVYFRLNKKTMKGEGDLELWATEAWYTLNSIPGKETAKR